MIQPREEEPNKRQTRHPHLGAGRVVTVLQGGSGVPPLEHHYAYDPATLALTSETVIAEGQTNVLTRTHDIFGRAAGLTVAGVDDPGDTPYAISYTHDPLGRFAHAIATDGGFTATNTYAYLSGSGLSAGWAARPVVVTREYGS
ncbi:MAG: hypothetical protein U1E27_03285 [Kiritimatiellia bacterium]|nr:hypothetical protein [Kiritimatiellia bacterium]